MGYDCRGHAATFITTWTHQVSLSNDPPQAGAKLARKAEHRVDHGGWPLFRDEMAALGDGAPLHTLPERPPDGQHVGALRGAAGAPGPEGRIGDLPWAVAVVPLESPRPSPPMVPHCPA